jgi:hypothetical protein
MAATDQPYRSQRILDIVFAVSCVVMLLSVVVMFAQDYYRPFKVEQREFRNVETAVFERSMIDRLPDEETIAAVEETGKKLAEARKAVEEENEKISRQMRGFQAERVRLEAELQSIKATYDSLASLRDIDADAEHTQAADAKEAEMARLSQQMIEKQTAIDKARAGMEELQRPVKKLEAEKAREVYQVLVEKRLAPPTDLNSITTLSQTEDPVKRATTEIDRLAKTTAQKKWKVGDWFRALPVIDGFASPYRIEQFTLDNLPIDYNFKKVTRYDRCHTCHLGIDRPTFDREILASLDGVPEGAQAKLDQAHQVFRRRQDAGENLGFSLGDLPSQVRATPLTPAQVTQYAAHPRLDLFVDSNSPHSAEKFGCTICHSGQGSGTEFNHAAHTPNNAAQREEWEHEHHWHSSHYWDFPMLPHRFVDSSFLKWNQLVSVVVI